jgi:cytochrome c oxidase subunit 2
MPSYAAQIPVADRWAIVAYVKAAQMKKDSTVPIKPGKVTGPTVTVANAEAGAVLYKTKTCNACHSIDGSKLVGPSFKGVWGKTEATSAGDVTVDLAYLKESIATPMAKIVNGYPPAMPPQVLTDLEIESIALFMQTLK